MPIREYVVREGAGGCDYCSAGFEQLEQAGQAPLTTCPRCGAPVERKFSAPQVCTRETNLHDRAKSAGFHSYKRIGKGEYEKQY
jgi:predicted nucleic acid-binding Zn ribbon protein